MPATRTRRTAGGAAALLVAVAGLGTARAGPGPTGPVYRHGLNTFGSDARAAPGRRWHLEHGAEWNLTDGHDAKGCLRLSAGSRAGFDLAGPGSEDRYLHDDYELSLWVRRTGRVRLDLCVAIEGPEPVGQTWRLAQTSEGQWTRLRYRTGAFARLHRGRLTLRAQGAGTIWIDDFEIAGRLRADPAWQLEPAPGLPTQWPFRLDRKRRGVADRYYAPAVDSGAWTPMPVDRWWEQAGHKGYNGWGWYRTSFVVPQGQRIYVHFGAVDEIGTVWVNGRCVATHCGWDHPFQVRIDHVARPGHKAHLVVLVEDYYGAGGIYKTPVLMVAHKPIPRLLAPLGRALQGPSESRSPRDQP